MVSEQRMQEENKEDLIYFFERFKSLRLEYHEADPLKLRDVEQDIVIASLAFANFLEASPEVVKLLKADE